MSYDIDKVTPRPWRVNAIASMHVESPPRGGVCSTGGHFNNTEEDGGFAENQANAAHIVHCVNTHDRLQRERDELVEALEALLTMAGNYTYELKEGEAFGDSEDHEAEYEKAKVAALALLAKVKS